MAPSLSEKIFNEYDWNDINETTLHGDDHNDDLDVLVVELVNVSSLLNETFNKKIYHPRAAHYAWEYYLIIFIIALVVVSLIINFICGCVYCGLTRENSILEFRLRYRIGR